MTLAARPGRCAIAIMAKAPRLGEVKTRLVPPLSEADAALLSGSFIRDIAGNILAVEMEAAALYAFGRARDKPVLCLAHVTNRMAVDAGDFEKGEADGADASLRVIAAVAHAWRRRWGGEG